MDRALRERPELDCHMLLTVHDELVFEVPKDRAEEAVDLIRDRMEHAVDARRRPPGRRRRRAELVGGGPRGSLSRPGRSARR